MRAWWIAGLGLLTALGWSQPLPNMRMFVDDNAVAGRGVYLYGNTYMVPVKTIFGLVSEENASAQIEGSTVTISYRGKKWISMPITADGSGKATIYDALGDGATVREVTLEEPPRWIDVKKVKTAMIDVDSLDELIGVSNDIVGGSLSLFTPKYWRSKLKLTGDLLTDSLAKNSALQPLIGVTPPASTLLISGRGPESGFMQIYKFEGGIATPMLGRDIGGGNVSTLNPTAGDRPFSRPCTASDAAIAETMFTGKLPPFGYYVAIFTKKPFNGADVLQAIREGQLSDSEWSLGGVRQRVSDSPVSYAPYTVKTARTVESVAKEKDMSPALLAAINSTTRTAKLSPGQKLIVIDGFNDEVLERQFNPKFKVVGLHVVQPGDTVSKLAGAWGVSTDFFYAANPDVPEGADLDPGDLVSVAVPVKAASDDPPKKNTIVFERASGRGLTKTEVALRKFTTENAEIITKIPARSAVAIMGRVAQLGLLKVSYRDVEGYISESSVRAPQGIQIVRAGPVTIPSAVRFTGDPSKFAKEGMKYLGTPYKWGGNDPTRGIDCSHFVHQVYVRVGERTPEPPVHEMEQYGDITGWMQTSYHVGDRSQGTFRNADPFDHLQPGDRIIMQNRPSGQNKSDHHIGIYLGSITTRQFGYQRHALIHACGSQGVTIYDLDRKYQNIYKFAARGPNRGRWYSSIHPGDIASWAFNLKYGAKR